MANQDDNWFGNWLNAARDKSSKVYEFVKKDLEEFGSAVRNEATQVVSTTGSAIGRTLQLDSPDSTAGSMKRSFSSFLGQMNTVLNPTPDDSDTEAILITENSESVPLTKLQQAIYELQKNNATFIDEPQLSLKQKYECWLEIVDDQLNEERLNKHLKSSDILLKQYGKLVPECVSHSLFWKRYLFKKALIEDEIAYQEETEKREKKPPTTTTSKWESEELSQHIELTEEEQIKLLEEYENEIKNKSKTIPTNLEQELKTSLNKVDSAISIDGTSSNSSIDDGDWEKINDI